jgi:hypothetical protein
MVIFRSGNIIEPLTCSSSFLVADGSDLILQESDALVLTSGTITGHRYNVINGGKLYGVNRAPIATSAGSISNGGIIIDL